MEKPPVFYPRQEQCVENCHRNGKFFKRKQSQSQLVSELNTGADKGLELPL
jgi:hypothetical protein